MRSLVSDVKHALRLYRSTPQSSAFAVVALAIAMAAICALLSLWSDLALKPHPGFENGGALMTIGQLNGPRFEPLSLRLIEAIDAEAASVDTVAGVQRQTQFLDRDGERDSVATELVTVRYFSDIRPRLQWGRGFDAQDHRADASPVAVISERFWNSEFGGRDDVLGRTVLVSGPDITLRGPAGEARAADQVQAYRIVGVMASGMTGTFGSPTDIWMPYEQTAEALLGGAGDLHTRLAMLLGIARPSERVNVEAVRTELDGRYVGSGEELGMLNGRRFDVESGVVPDVNVQRDVERQVLLFLAGGVLLAMVAACNISLFLLSRAPGRRRELGIRLAVGAPVKRLARQLAAEAGLLVALSAVLGLMTSLWLTAFMRDLPFLQRADWRSASPLDWRVLLMVCVVTLLLTLLVSLAPVVGLRRLGIAAASRSVTARAGLGQRLAGSAQLAVAGVLGGSAIAFGWYTAALAVTDLGFDSSNVQIVALNRQQPGFGNVDAIVVERERVRSIFARLPGVDAVAFGNSVPGNLLNLFTRAGLPGEQERSIDTWLVSADSSYFDVLGMRFVDGRGFAAGDREGVIVNETLALRLWQRTDVAGEVLADPNPASAGGQEVIGVVGDAAYDHPASDARPLIYMPATGISAADSVLVRTRLASVDLRSLIQSEIDNGELGLEIRSVDSLQQLWGRMLTPDRARTWLVTVSAGLVVLLAGFGFYGTQRYLVGAGRREYAIRAALGAGPRSIGRLVATRGFLLAVPGWLLGAVLAAVAVTWLRDQYLSTAVSVAAVTAAVIVGIGVLVAVANSAPARLARRMAPAPLLKEE